MKLSLPGKISRAQAILVFSLIPLGLLSTILIPWGAGFDEDEHLRRIWEMSAFDFIPNSKLGPEMPVPGVYENISYRAQPIIRPVDFDTWLDELTEKIDSQDWRYSDIQTRSIYSPPLLLPQAMVMRWLGRKYDIPAMPVIYVARAVGLMGYVLLLYFAVRIIPFGKWMLTIVGVAPTALYQASTLTADAYSNGLAFLFIAVVLNLQRRTRLGRRETCVLLLATFLLFLTKTNLSFLVILLFILLRPNSFHRKSHYAALILGVIALFLIEVVGWYLVAYPKGDVMLSGNQPGVGIIHLIRQPLPFILNFIADIWGNGLGYLKGWAAEYGYFYWSVPAPVYLLFALGVLCALVLDQRLTRPSREVSWSLVIVGGITLMATSGLIQVAGTTVGSGEFRELVGRYFTGIMPLFMLGLLGLPELRLPWISSRMYILSGMGSLIFFVTGVFLSYHVQCGGSYYSLGLCYAPQYKNWSPQRELSPPLQHTIIEEEFPVECRHLSEVRFWILRPSGQLEGVLTYTLERVADHEEVTYGSLPLSQLPTSGWLEWDFSPEIDSLGLTYRLTVEAQGVSGTAAPQLGYTIRPEYRAGQMFVNGQASDMDLFFQYGCTAGLRRLVD
jgi:uncharacterized membrane protein